jgi:hypothetical protein
MGGMAIGSAIWGVVAARVGIDRALAIAAVGMLLAIAASYRYSLPLNIDLRLLPSAHQVDPIVMVEPDPEEGPVLVQIEYRIDPEKAVDFREVMLQLRRIRRRDGAVRWGLFHDPAEPGRYVESFLVDSWAEHLRQHDRAILADLDFEQRARAFHISEDPPVTIHLIADMT